MEPAPSGAVASSQVSLVFATARSVNRLQWGRTQLSAEIVAERTCARVHRRASMGPHSIECGNCSLLRRHN